jgi:hypothetical protein
LESAGFLASGLESGLAAGVCDEGAGACALFELAGSCAFALPTSKPLDIKNIATIVNSFFMPAFSHCFEESAIRSAPFAGLLRCRARP